MVTIAASCSTDIQQEPIRGGASVGEVLISAKDFEYDPASRTSFNITSSGAEFLWAEKDTVGIFPDKGTQVEFPMSQGAGTKTAAFDGGGWGLKSENTYYAYYPFSRKYYMTENAKNNIYVSYQGQTQNGNGNLDHLGAYDFMAATGKSPSNGSLNLNFIHLGALVQLTIEFASPATVKSLTLNSDNYDFIIDGYMDITDSTPHIIPITKSNSFEIGVNEIGTVTRNQSVIVYFMLAPTDLSSSKLSLSIVETNGLFRIINLPPKNFQAGKAYALYAEPTKVNGQEYVDLGLPSGIKWATCNVGADKPSDYGDYFAWGEVETKDKYTTSNSKWYEVENELLQSQGVIDANCNLTAQHDAATVIWGDSWRMPTSNELLELYEKCSWNSTILDDHKGYKVTGPNGNYIFLPVAGCNSDPSLHDVEKICYYWSATANEPKYFADGLHIIIKDYYHNVDHPLRYGGYSVRPVTE